MTEPTFDGNGYPTDETLETIEDVICAMQKNFVFWSLFWLRSERGGLFVFDNQSVA